MANVCIWELGLGTVDLMIREYHGQTFKGETIAGDAVDVAVFSHSVSVSMDCRNGETRIKRYYWNGTTEEERKRTRQDAHSARERGIMT